jgi:hypothetical protein
MPLSHAVSNLLDVAVFSWYLPIWPYFGDFRGKIAPKLNFSKTPPSKGTSLAEDGSFKA